MKLKQQLSVLLALTLALAAPAFAESTEMLIEQMVSGEVQGLVKARQMLRRKGAEAVPHLVPLIDHENPDIWYTARNVLSDVANAVCAPGRPEEERLQVTDQLMKMLAPEQSERMKEQGLRLLPIIVPEGYDVGPIADLLQADTMMQEKARRALESIGTTEAREALEQFLPEADDDFKAAILNSLGRIDAAASSDLLVEHARHENPGVRAAAARSLAQTGDPRYIGVMQDLRSKAGEDTHFDITNSMLQLADAVIHRGGNWDAGIDVYREVLKTETDPVLKAAAISGLARFGDDTAAADIAQALKEDAEGVLAAPAAVALGNLSGRGAHLALLDIYESASPELQTLLLGVLGRKGDPLFLEILNKEVQSSDAQRRRAAYDALAASGLPGAVEGIGAYLQQSSPEERQEAVAQLEGLARQFAGANNPEAAGSVYLVLYDAAEDKTARQQALEGMMQYPVEASYPVLMQALDTMPLEEAPATLLGGLARALKDSGRDEEAQRALEALLQRTNSTEGVQQVLELREYLPEQENLAHDLGFLTEFVIVGPFPWAADNGFAKNYIDEPYVDLSASYAVDSEQRAWTPASAPQAPSMVEFASRYGMPTNATAFAYTEIEVPQETEAVLRMGSDDGIKAWVNANPVHENNVDRGTELDADQAPVELKSGRNALLFQITQGGGGWNFMARLTGPDGRPLDFQQVPAQSFRGQQ